ncbi:MAG: ribbon-helix-helix protein, CopG family [Spirochaetales bacterium]
MINVAHRTTFALDELAVQRLRLLAARWHISQSEVIRRALEKLEAEPAPVEPDPATELAYYHSQGGLDSEVAESYIATVSEDRKSWRGE